MRATAGRATPELGTWLKWRAPRVRIAPADSSGYRNSSGPISSIGFAKPKRLRGRSLSSVATQSKSIALCTEKSVPLGKYWRSSPLVFSHVARCQGACRHQKQMSMSAATLTCSQSRISMS